MMSAVAVLFLYSPHSDVSAQAWKPVFERSRNAFIQWETLRDDAIYQHPF